MLNIVNKSDFILFANFKINPNSTFNPLSVSSAPNEGELFLDVKMNQIHTIVVYT